MKTKMLILLGSSCVCSAVALADTPFRNLDFEAASVPVPPRIQGQPDHNVPISRGLPGWSGFRGTDSVSTVWYDDVTTGNANIDILDRNSGFGSQIIDGNFSILLQPGAHGIEERVSVSISQFGTVPANAESLQWKCSPFPFSISFAGEELSAFRLSSETDYALYGADISQFSGQSGQLKFTAINSMFLDSFVFSPDPVPEPSVLGLFGVGLLLLGRRLLRRKI